MKFRCLIILFFCFCGCVPSTVQKNEEITACKFSECTKESICRDIFAKHQSGEAVDISSLNDKPVCSYGTYYDSENNKVIGDKNNLVGSLHTNTKITIMEKKLYEGACVFSPLGAYYATEGQWYALPELFKDILYRQGAGNQNCVIHFSVESSSHPPSIFLKLGELWIGDKVSTAFKKYGKADKIHKFDDGVIAYLFSINKQKNAYLAIEVFPYEKEYIWSVQISGKDKIPIKGLMGIDIGSTESELIKKFGIPTERKSLTDILGELITYKGRNYSFELDEKKKVRSIKILMPESVVGYLGK